MGKVAQLYESTEAVNGKREAILDAALHLFTERGFHGTAMPLVAEQAGVGAGTIYRYFASKEALVNSLYQHWKEFQIATVKKDVPTNLPLREQFRIYWGRLIDFANQFPVAFAFLELHFHAPYLDENSLAMEVRGRKLLLNFFNDGVRQQVLKAVPAELLASLVIGAYIGLMKSYRACGLTLTAKQIAQAEACCWEAIRL